MRAGRLGSTDANLVITWWVPDSFGPDQFSEVVIAPGFDPVTTKAIQVFVRRQAAGVPWRYGFHYDPTRGDYELKYDGGPGVIIARRPGSHFVPGDVVRIEVRGTTLSGFLNGVLILSTTHTALADGLTGVAINPLDDPALYAFESWRGGKLAGLEPSASALRRIR